ncbi:16S rRNA (cytosine(967)-C(5))-methyltransferase RsmB [Candidatus Accumulibacter sp. ACC003]|uniref:16S rRNA (cytosine(967)-C(5))-methyltransferase RsmB n=1 Tax=Candidatus Accumulibacter sp. ACC003 TaxID=2823334 RepID=UPI0025C0BC5E|nr:16S rRNA (cytosine(967)-C(5))-methyltransferase RsmB [Candidatus Accumulibacter sp. ACC003]
MRKSASQDQSAPARPAAAAPSLLAPDSLAYSLLLAARVIAQVHAGQSLTQALTALGGTAAAARAAAQDVAFGSLRWYGCGEFILGRLLSKALPHPDTEGLLLAALYRLQTRPESAHVVVDQAVAAAGELAGGAFKGLVNGVLRNYLRERDVLHIAMAADEVAAQQHPSWWLARLRRAYPERWREIAAIGNVQPPMTLRVNQRRLAVADYLAQLQAAGLSARPLGSAALILDKAVAVDTLPGFADGCVSIQDAGAQRAAELLAPTAGQRVLDACAAPGGKTAHLLETADVELVALDVDALRARRIEDNLRRLGLAATVRVGDCRASEQWWDGNLFDAILADVPCSASGVVRRHPDIKYLRRESDIRQFARLQAEILDQLWSLLKAGGRFLYATCSLFPEENGAQIDAFLCRQPDARRLSEERLLPQDEHDGFFYALLQKAA